MNPLVVSGIIMSTLIIILLLILLYNSASVPSSSNNCPTSYCPTNLLTGVKDCSRSDYNPDYEVCNPPTSCSNPLTPFAQNADGSSNKSGTCENNSTCPCVSALTCPSYITSYLAPNVSVNNQQINELRITFTQYGGLIPVNYTGIGTAYCTLPGTWWGLATPGCTNYINTTPNINDLSVCMSLTGTCLSGSLAVITDNPSMLTQQNIVEQQMGCIGSSACSGGDILVYNTSTASSSCLNPQQLRTT